MLNAALAFIVCLYAMSPRLGAQTSWYVDASASLGGNGSSAAPFQAIMDAVNAAASGDLVYLAPGTYPGGDVDLGLKNLTIASLLGPATVTIMNTPGSAGAFKIDGPATGTTSLFDLSFSAGSTSEFVVSAQHTQLCVTGCIFIHTNLGARATAWFTPSPPAQILIDGCVFDDSVLTFKHDPRPIGTVATIINSEFNVTPGVYFRGSSLAYSSIVISDCHIHDNTNMQITADGGSIGNSLFEDITVSATALVLAGSNMQVSSCDFRNCFRAISLSGFSQLVEASTFEGCSIGVEHKTIANGVIRDCSFAPASPGTGITFPSLQGVTSTLGDLTIDRCSFRGLFSSVGSAVSASAPLTMTNCTIQDCSALYSAGAVYVNQSYFDIGNCSFIDNTSALGATLHIVLGSIGQVRNSIIRGSASQHVFGQPYLSHCDVQGGWAGPGTRNFDADPLFVDLPNGDLHLAPGSPCIDAGDFDTTGLSALDLDSNPRLAGNYVDVGAYESPIGPATLPGTGDDLLMVAKKNNVRINSGAIAISGGDYVSLKILSPQHGLDAFPVWLMGELFPTGGSPILPASHPAVHLNLSIAEILFDPSIASVLPGWASGLPATGLDLASTVPFGFTGNTYRLQTFMLSPITANGWYAATNAYDLQHQ